MSKDKPGHRATSPPSATADQIATTILPVVRILVLIAGIGIAGLGLSCSAAGLLGVLLGQMGRDVEAAAAVQGVTFYTGFVALSSILGLALAWHAWRSIQRRPSAPFYPPPTWPLLLLFLLALAAGQIILSADLLPALTFPLAHVAVAVIPPLAIVALTGRALRGISNWRTMTLQLAGGAFLGTFLAFALELAILLVLFVGAMAAIAIQPGGEQILTDLADGLTRLQLEDPSVLFELLDVPLVAVGAIVVVAVVVPLLEELVKTAGVGIMAYRRPGQAQAILWGVAAGAGFATVEGLFNTLGSLDSWALIVVLRIGATLLHCFTGALMGLAWHHVLAGRWLRAIGLYAGSVMIHAAWNGLSMGMALVSVDTGGGGNVTPDVLVAGTASTVLLVLLIALAGGMASGLAWIVRRANVAAT
ncbi:MAG TPA: PrsW family glutamic-type intramembrane protease [Anaerolineae bacterium]|nr:PrsW family glutamic-type intramembrane protease [Anaerolineae bacterium]